MAVYQRLHSNRLVLKGCVSEMLITRSRNYVGGIGLFSGMSDLSNTIAVGIKIMPYVGKVKYAP